MTATARSIRYGGIVLVAAGALALGYTAVRANTQATVLSGGPLTAMRNASRDDAVPAILGIVALLDGITLLKFDGRRLEPR